MRKHLIQWTPKALDKWELAREKGKWRFVFLGWVIGWGGIMILFMSCFWAAIFALTAPIMLHFLSIMVLYNCVAFPIGGLICGNIVWYWIDRSYKQARRAETEKTDSARQA